MTSRDLPRRQGISVKARRRSFDEQVLAPLHLPAVPHSHGHVGCGDVRYGLASVCARKAPVAVLRSAYCDSRSFTAHAVRCRTLDDRRTDDLESHIRTERRHVAERTIYSNPAIAALMNQWFVRSTARSGPTSTRPLCSR